MKKLLLSIVIILVLALTIVTVIQGLHIGGINILGVKEIQEEDQSLEKKLTEATQLVSTEYPNKLSELDTDISKMKEYKQKYEDMVAVSTDSEVAASLQTQKYTVDKLWSRLGTLATDEGLTAVFKLTNGTLTSTEPSSYKYYNINFTVRGSYVGISLYISDLEDNSDLGFKIEDFKMTPINNGSQVEATFVTKDIAISGITAMTNSSNDEIEEDSTTAGSTKHTTQNTSNSTTKNTTVTSNTTTTKNTTNTTNTTKSMKNTVN